MIFQKFQDNIWNNFLLSCIFKGGELESEKKNIVAYRDDGQNLIILSKKDNFDIRGFDSTTRQFFDLKDIELAYKLLIKTKAEEISIIKPEIWEEFKRAVVLNELMK